MPLDPIVSLTVALAEARGSYAFFLGSGVSRDAGVPTGAEVFWRAVGELYRVERTTAETPAEAGLKDWLDETGRSDFSYSQILELITPDPAGRRDYLAKHFEGIQPGPTHEGLADLAIRGLVSVFVTTNFDRLLEHALLARGVEPVVVSSEDILVTAPRREHSSSYILKPHGDYLQETIRNTPAELAELEPGVSAELQEVLNRYGVVVLGYSGGDEAISKAMRQRRSRYSIYWVARGELAASAKSIVDATGARVILRATAADFLRDLDHRLAVFEAHPSGLTPIVVSKEVVRLLRTGDDVGLSEFLRTERREFGEHVRGFIQGHRHETPNHNMARDIHQALLPVMERRLASLLPLVLYQPEGFAREAQSLAELKERLPTRDGLTFWPDVCDWCVWWLFYAAGSFVARMRRFPVLTSLFEMQIRTRGRQRRPLFDSLSERAGSFIGEAVMAAQGQQTWFDPAWQALQQDLVALDLVREEYPELAEGEDEPLRSLVEFDFVVSAGLRCRGRNALGRWTEYETAAHDFARELNEDDGLRAEVAQAVGLTLEDFDANAPAALRSVVPFGGFADFGAVEILEAGRLDWPPGVTPARGAGS